MIWSRSPARSTADPKTGQLTTSFTDNPQLPFEDLAVQLPRRPAGAADDPADLRHLHDHRRPLAPGRRPTDPDAGETSLDRLLQVTQGPAAAPCPNGPGFNPKLQRRHRQPARRRLLAPSPCSSTRDDGTQQLSAI